MMPLDYSWISSTVPSTCTYICKISETVLKDTRFQAEITLVLAVRMKSNIIHSLFAKELILYRYYIIIITISLDYYGIFL